jgi:AGZA family xanthine/uracil permease-like MFS transporter
MSLRQSLEGYFEFDRLGTSWRTEIVAGFTTFITMAYIIFVNPGILAEAGMPFTGVLAATCLSAAVGSILMGSIARYPIALAPGMGLNAYFTFAVVKGMGVAWPVALGAVFLSGIAFFVLTGFGIRRMIVSAIPTELYAAVAAGIGLFIALIGFRNSGIIVSSPETTVTLGNLRAPTTLLAIFGLVLTAALLARGYKAAMLIGILVTTAVAALTGLVSWKPLPLSLADLTATAGKLDIAGAIHLGGLEIIFVFLFVDLFDNVGTLVGVGKKAGLFNEANQIPRLNRILFCDAAATLTSSLAGTSTVVSYIESAAGVVAGGRTGIPAIVTGILFLLAMPVAPLIGAIPAAATAPALILVGCMMLSHVAEIDWSDMTVALPAFLTITMVPLSFSIANGLAFGFTSYTLLRMLRGEFRKVNWLMYILTALFLVRFWYLGGG